ncbi:MAG TPA: class I SAM-dependent methyltransferase [Oxalicibacterium sp.]|uniref:class I SAM-dependent methyltransferase n=1 Tax=Oxalicibacterium sp. TaxID=2766525 RepID=UPI002B9FF47B|nr:class I SAM-dependent methyltransferase [Oxalicibacterium sp.]HWU98322.1 class I SAM-dependent methyltransferase [Oxalicibacterium sp.]
MSTQAVITWDDAGEERSVRWQSERGAAAPKRVVIADDTLNADSAFRLASEGTGLLWRGDYQNARQLLQALARRIDRKPRKAAASAIDAFNQHRQLQSQRARTLGMLLIEIEDDYVIPLRRAPDIKLACNEAYGASNGAFVVSLREILGLIGAHEWRKTGVEIPALGARIHPYYGVFSPVRGEYLDLIAEAPLPATSLAFDIGTGTGVIAALLAKRGIKEVIATDQDARALSCARENIKRLDLTDRVEIVDVDLFPEGKAPLIVCNPPWIPARPSSAIEYAIYDPDSRMLRGFLGGLAGHLTAKGEGWLILSDLAEHLGLRSREELQQMIDDAGLKVIARMDTKPVHPRAADENDPLHDARSREVTSLWRLTAR